MAVQKTVETPWGSTYEGAYWRFNSWDEAPNRQADGTFSVPHKARFRPFVSQAAFAQGKQCIGGVHSPLDVIVQVNVTSLGTAVDEAYAALKALPAFEGAEDA